MANIFEINRVSNKITLGTTGTTINIASHTASRLLALDASKNLEVVTIGSSLDYTRPTLNTIQDIRTSDSPQFAGIELGHATDTTITRVSAGVIAVEGTTIMLVGDTPTAHTHDGRYYTETEIDNGFQPLDAELTSLAGLSYAAASFVKMTGANAFVLRTIGETQSDLGIDLNTTHRGSDGSDHSYLDQAVTIASTPEFAGITTTGAININRTVGGFRSLNFNNSDGNDWYMDAYGGRLRFHELTPTNAERMTILPGGNIGMGTPTPYTRLTVEGTITLKERAYAFGDTAAYGQDWVKNTDPCQRWYTDDTGIDYQLSGITTEVLNGSAVWNPGAVADGSYTSRIITITGAALGDFVLVSFNLLLERMILVGHVSYTDNVVVVLYNNTGGAVDLAEGTVYVRVLKK